MLRTAFLSLFLFVSLSTSTSIIRKSISRRQSDPQYCHAIEGFDCKCSYYRVTCTTDRDLPATLNIVENEKHKYQSVELVIAAARDISVNDHTFEPVKELYKSDTNNAEFRLKFEKFTSLHLTSPGLLNRVFPNNFPQETRKHLALEIYNPDVPPHDNRNLFQGLNADSLELYALYPFSGTFQELFNGANVKYLRLSGGDIRSDLNQPFTGNVARLELAKQANALSVQNFPVYPAHEFIINAFYVTDFNNAHPPNYNNLAELRVHSQEAIPAHAFRQYPNLRVLSLTTEKDIDPHALDGLNQLEKLTIKDTKAPASLLNSVPSIKEYETNIEKLDENTQCQLLEKLANGQVAIQAIPNGRECTCVSAYLEAATGRTPCDAQNCDRSSCAAIKNNYDASTRTFKAPPAIRRADGSDALRPRDARVYTAPFQVAHQDHEKLQNALPQQQQQQQQQPGDQDTQRPQDGQQPPYQPEQPYPHHPQDQQGGQQGGQQDGQQDGQQGGQQEGQGQDQDGNREPGDNQSGNEGGETRPEGEGGDNQGEGQGNTNQQPNQEGTDNQGFVDAGVDNRYDAEGNIIEGKQSGDDTAIPPKKGMSWIPIIIIAAAIIGLLLIGLIVLLLRKRRAKAGYNPPPREPAHA